MRAVKFPSLPHCSRQVSRRASVKALGLETLWPAVMWVSTRAGAVSSQCGAALHLVEGADRVRRLTAAKVAVQSKVDAGLIGIGACRRNIPGRV
jgi:hypothetical protein